MSPPPRPRLPRRRSVVLATACTVLVAGCGSGGSHGASAPNAPNSGTTAPAAATTPGTATTLPTTATTAAPSATTSTPAASAVDTGGCYAGTWVSTGYTQAVVGEQISGGAGIKVGITDDEISMDFSGMQPVSIGGKEAGQGIFAGQEEAPASFTSAGSFRLPTRGTSDVTFQVKLAGQSSYSPPISAGGFPTGGIAGTYSCNSSTLTLAVPTAQGTTTIT